MATPAPAKPSATITTAQVLLQNPCSELTRKERRNLLAASTIGFLIAKAGLMPTKIAFLGIDFPLKDPTLLLYVLTGIITYFELSMFFYATSDIAKWRASYSSAEQTPVTERKWPLGFFRNRVAGNIISKLHWKWNPLLLVFWEFMFPLFFALLAIVSMQRTTGKSYFGFLWSAWRFFFHVG